MGKPIEIGSVWLREQYLDAQRSVVSIAAEVGCSPMGLTAALDRHGVPRRNQTEARRLVPAVKSASVPAGEVAELYESGVPIKVLAPRYGVSHATLRQVLVGAGVEIRTSADSARIRWADPEYRRYRLGALEHRRRPTGVRKMKRLLAQDAVCAWCESQEHVEQHHINATRSDHHPENIAPLCRDCHAKLEWFIGRATDGLRRTYKAT